MKKRANSPRQARFRVELKKLLERGVPAAKAMKTAWAKVPKNPRKKTSAGVTIATRWCPTCQKHHVPIGNGGRHARNIAAGFYDDLGVFHPIRASHDYSAARAGERRRRGRRYADRQKPRRRGSSWAGALSGENPRRARMNGPVGGTEIYGKIKAIEAVKGPNSNYEGQLFRHDFNKPARVFGMPDGSLRIVPSGGR